ncbi:hypothetical protein ACGFI9_21810 [Micromonospora sp. NPDC048930]|uniref:hypothetical protein n=1 Tax=Micromonospora sp. NPDC048930 TaxID=3364261 RepID=UPI003714B450
MSAVAMRWARRQRAGGTTPTALLNWLAARVDPGHHSRYCGVREIADALGCSDRTVYNAVARLTDRQLLRVLRRGKAGGGRGFNRLQLLVDGPDTPLPPHGDFTSAYDPATEAAKARARKAARAAQPSGEEPTKPANVAGLVETHPGGQTCKICRNEPEICAGTNLQNLQVPNKQELQTPTPNPLPPPHSPPAPPGRAAADGQEDEEESPPDTNPDGLDDARQVLGRLQAEMATRLATWQQARLLPAIAAALAAGWPPGGLVREVFRAGDPGLADNPYGALRFRLGLLGPPPVTVVPDPPPAPAVCPAGRCDGSGRFLIDGDVDRPARCPDCHPHYRRPAAG